MRSLRECVEYLENLVKNPGYDNEVVYHTEVFKDCVEWLSMLEGLRDED